MPPPIQYDIQGLMMIIRSEFKRHKQEITGRKYNPNVRHDNESSWRAAAENCVQLNADPYRFVEACFKQCRSPAGPFANQLGGPGAKNWYLAEYPSGGPANEDDYVAPDQNSPIPDMSASDLVREEFKMAIELLVRRTGSKQPFDWYKDLMNFLVPIQPYTRVCLGHSLPGILEEWGEKACEQVTRNPALYNALIKMGFVEFENIYKNYVRKH